MDRLSAELNVLVRVDPSGLRKLKIPRALKALNQKLVGKGSVLKMPVDLPDGRPPGPKALSPTEIRADLLPALPCPTRTSAWDCILVWAFSSKMLRLGSGSLTRIVASAPGQEQACCTAETRLDLPRVSLWEIC